MNTLPFSIYARKHGDKSVTIYRDEAATNVFCRYTPDRQKPDRRNKWLTLNCYRWRLVWVAN